MGSAHRRLEAVVKGFANHRRIEIMELLDKRRGLSVFAIAGELKVNYKTISEHLRRLHAAGLVYKRNSGVEVVHGLTDLGTDVLTFLRILE